MGGCVRFTCSVVSTIPKGGAGAHGVERGGRSGGGAALSCVDKEEIRNLEIIGKECNFAVEITGI